MVADLIDRDTVGAGYEVFNKRLKDVFDHYGGVLGATRFFSFCASGRFVSDFVLLCLLFPSVQISGRRGLVRRSEEHLGSGFRALGMNMHISYPSRPLTNAPSANTR